jgi:hypothetical protein
LSGQQLGLESGTPSAVQCENVEDKIADLTIDDTFGYGWTWAWGARDYIDSNFEDFRAHWGRIRGLLCPPLPDSETLRDIVDSLAFRYRSLGRPNPMLWYGTLFLLVSIIPWARKQYLDLVLTASVFLFNHAFISAIIDNVQPRYVVVTNPFRSILLLVLVFIGVRILFMILTWAGGKDFFRRA